MRMYIVLVHVYIASYFGIDPIVLVFTEACESHTTEKLSDYVISAI